MDDVTKAGRVARGYSRRQFLQAASGMGADRRELSAATPAMPVVGDGTCPACGEPWCDAASIADLGERLTARGASAPLVSFLATCPSCRERSLSSSLRERMRA